MAPMHDKDPSLWAALFAWLSVHQPQLYAAMMSVGIAALRVIYGGGTRRQALLEGALCGGLTLTLISAFEYFGLPQSLSTFVGGWVGFLGVRKIADIADRVSDWKLPKREG